MHTWHPSGLKPCIQTSESKVMAQNLELLLDAEH